MKIIADENIPCVAEAFATLGEVRLLPGRALRAGDVRVADLLLVRSVTRVDADLLAGSRVRFVGSATIGFDHIDRDYLHSRGIGFSTAPGSNATSAAEYVVSAIMALSERDGVNPAERSVGIIGCGNVGSRVRNKLSALGMECLVNDPPLQERGVHEDFVALDAVLQADVITVHVPLTRHGSHPTFHLIDAALLRKLPPGAVLINTARGAVADNQALNSLLAERPDLSVVLDVWEGEPAINMSLLEKVALGTPHIAGYSLDGKLRGTEMIYRAACEYFDLPVQWQAAGTLPERQVVDLEVNTGDDLPGALKRAVFHAYDVREDDVRLRELLGLSAQQQASGFDRLRKEYPVRREFPETTIRVRGDNDRFRQMLRGLGFTVM